MPKVNYKKFFVIAVISLILYSNHGASAGFGVSPPNISHNNIKPGAKIARKISVLRSSSEERWLVKIMKFAPHFGDWISFGPDTWRFEKGATRKDVTVKINVPEGAKAGIYNGYLQIKLVPAEGQGSIALGARISLELTVKPAEIKTKFAGRFFLQTQSHGELWYVDPAGNKKYSIKSSYDLRELVVKHGLGVKHQIILSGNKKSLAGRFLIDTQDKGKAYYIDPSDNKAYLLAYNEVGLKNLAKLATGISDEDLKKIK